MSREELESLVRKEAAALLFIDRTEVSPDGKLALFYGKERTEDDYLTIARISVKLCRLLGDYGFRASFVPPPVNSAEYAYA